MKRLLNAHDKLASLVAQAPCSVELVRPSPARIVLPMTFGSAIQPWGAQASSFQTERIVSMM